MWFTDSVTITCSSFFNCNNLLSMCLGYLYLKKEIYKKSKGCHFCFEKLQSGSLYCYLIFLNSWRFILVSASKIKPDLRCSRLVQPTVSRLKPLIPIRACLLELFIVDEYIHSICNLKSPKCSLMYFGTNSKSIWFGLRAGC